MRITELRSIAKEVGIHNFSLLETERQLTLAIQKARGEDSCFLSDKRTRCADVECEWRPGCLRLIAEWRR